jgi:hypothetical protein
MDWRLRHPLGMQLKLGPNLVGAVLCSLLSLAWGCSSGTQSNTAGPGSAGSTSGGGETGNAGGSTAGGGSGSAKDEFPCEVQALLATKCLLCHKIEPPGSLLSSADFRKPSKADPQKTVGELALLRLQATDNTRMPPAPLEVATPAELAALKAWVQAGASAGSCDHGVATGPDPYATPVVCTSMKNWTGGNRESPLMRPGGACISCHKDLGEGPIFAVSGTVFPSAHEPDDCNGTASALGAKVVVTEANGTLHMLEVNSAGNFYLEAPTFAYPYQAKVVYGGKERVMVEAQTSGDCNDCHTQDGREKAPGRIFLP